MFYGVKLALSTVSRIFIRCQFFRVAEFCPIARLHPNGQFGSVYAKATHPNESSPNMKPSRRLATALCIGSALAFSAVPALADFIALDSTRAIGVQNWTGALGMDFNVNSAIRLTQLGAYDSGANGFAGPVQVGIFSRTTQSLVGLSATLTTANTTTSGDGLNRYFDVTDFDLGPGQYSIVAVGFDSFDLNGNTGFGGVPPTIDTGGGLISFVGVSRYTSNTSLVFPTTLDGGPANRYDAGTFQFVAVPEPGTFALVGLALSAIGLARRRRA